MTDATPNSLFITPYIARGAARHNDIRHGVAELSGKSFTPSHVRNEPLIFAGCAVKRPKDTLARTTGLTNWDNVLLPEATIQKGDLLIRDL